MTGTQIMDQKYGHSIQFYIVIFHCEDLPLSLGCQLGCWQVGCPSHCHCFFTFCLFPLATFLLFGFGIFSLTTVYLGVDFFVDYFACHFLLCIHRFIISSNDGTFSAIIFQILTFPHTQFPSSKISCNLTPAPVMSILLLLFFSSFIILLFF